MENKFYVYEWYNTDTNEVFYVGKGCGKRKDETKRRNQKFLSYIEIHPTASRIIKDNLSEEEAFALEKKTIQSYKEKGQCKCNLMEGGTGGISFIWTEEAKEYWSENNPMKTEAQRERMSKNNPMYNPEIAKKVGLKHRKAVIIDGVRYDSALTAAQALGVCDATIRTWCKRGYNPKGVLCSFAEAEKMINSGEKNKTPVRIDGVYYSSIKEASLALGMNSSTYLAKCIREHKTYKGHKCEYANQQPSQENSNNSILEGSTTNE